FFGLNLPRQCAPHTPASFDSLNPCNHILQYTCVLNLNQNVAVWMPIDMYYRGERGRTKPNSKKSPRRLGQNRATHLQEVFSNELTPFQSFNRFNLFNSSNFPPNAY